MMAPVLNVIIPFCYIKLCMQARSYDEASKSPLGWYIRNAQTRQLSHPLPVMRAREIDLWSQSSQYKALLAKNGIVSQ